MNVHQWLESRRCGNRFAAFLVMLLCALEGVYRFEVLSSFIRTYHNVTADALTRKTKSEVEALLKQLHLTEVDLKPAWKEHLERGWIRRAFTWKHQHEGMARTALQLASRRTPRSPPCELVPPRPGKMVRVCEWRGTLGNYVRSSTRFGGVTWMLPAPEGPNAAREAWPKHVAEVKDQHGFFRYRLRLLDRGQGRGGVEVGPVRLRLRGEAGHSRCTEVGRPGAG